MGALTGLELFWVVLMAVANGVGVVGSDIIMVVLVKKEEVEAMV